MPSIARFSTLLLALTAAVVAANAADGPPKAYTGVTCTAAADDSEFILLDPKKSPGRSSDDILRHNREQFAKMAKLKEKDQSRILLKVVGQLKHGGKVALKPDSAGYKVLAEFVRRLNAPT